LSNRHSKNNVMKLIRKKLVQGNSPPKRKIIFTFLTFNNYKHMKTSKLLIAIALLSFATSNAQITKGNWLVGGTGSFYSAQLKDDNNNTNSNSIGLEIRPNLGYFVMDKFAIGITPLIAYNKPENGSSVTSYGIGPYARYYLLKSDKRVNVLTHVGYSFSGSNNSSSKSTALDFKAGPVVYFNSSVAFEMTINYNINNLNSSTTYNILSLGLGLQIHLEK